MSVLFIVNPLAGRGSALKRWRQLQAFLPRSTRLDAVIPVSPAETRSVAAQAAQAGIERVVVVGGDGTLNAVAGALAFTDTSLGVIPAGTGNDFGRNCGLPRDLQAALSVALGRVTQRVDLGFEAGGRCFVNAAGVGFDAEVAAAASAYPSGLGGTLPYLLGALQTAASYRPTHMEVTVDDQHVAGPMTLVVIANGPYYGGGMQVAPSASHGDGTLDVCLAGNLGRMELLGLLRRVYTGGHLSHPKVRMLRGRRISLRTASVVRMHLDGEPGGSGHNSFRVEPGALGVAMDPALPRRIGSARAPLGAAP